MTVQLKELGSKLSYQDVNEIITLFTAPVEQEPAKLFEGQVWLKTTADRPVLMRCQKNGFNDFSWQVVGEVTEDNLMVLLKSKDGSGSGLDADLIDGLEASSFVRSDINSTVNSTITSTKSGAAIKFDSGHACITVHDGAGNFNIKSGVDENHKIIVTSGGSHIELSENGRITLAISNKAVGETFTDDIYIDISLSGVTINGNKVWHNGNQGHNSGLDADKLDGYHADTFVKVNNPVLMGKLNLGDIYLRPITIANGAITVTGSTHIIEAEGGNSPDDLVTINGGTGGDILILQNVSIHRPITLKDNQGNLRLNGDCVLGNNKQKILLFCVDFTPYDGIIEWHELSRSLN